VEQVFNSASPTAVRALAGIDLDVGAGAFVLVVGANGSGKSCLLNAIAAGQHTSGAITLAGDDITGLAPHARAARIAMVSQLAEDGSVGEFSVLENLALGRFRHRRAGLGRALSTNLRTETESELARMGLDVGARLESPAAALSGGERQIVALLMALYGRPEVLLLDEPTASLDVGRIHLVEELVTRFACSSAVPVVWVTHDPQQVLRLGNRLLVLQKGRIVADLDAKTKAALGEAEISAWIRGGRAGDPVEP
jgi:putative ABC transport system ATP-binding protein